MRKYCCEKRHKVKGAWSKLEDQKLIDYIGKHGEGRWRSLPQAAGLLRCGKSCRLRWINYLKPDVKRGNFGEDEEDLIIKLHALLGNRWSLIAGRLPGRTDNEVKNYWNTHLSKKLEKMGVDMSKHNRMQQAHSSEKRQKTRSSLVKNEECKSEVEESSKEDTDSTSGSVTGGGSSISVLPDLNLDLNMGALPVIEEKKKCILDPTHHPIEETTAFHDNADSSPLLLLFR